VTSTSGARSTAWLRLFAQATGAAVRLVCFPHAGGSASYYFPMATALAARAEVLALQYPGRQDRLSEPVLDDIATLADAIAVQLRGLDDRPTAFFGHSMGAVLAFEVTRLLERADDRPPIGLFVSGRRAPSTRRVESVHLRDDDGLIAELRTLNGTDAALFDDPDVRRMILPAVRADYTAIETYRADPGSIVRCPIEVLVGLDDPRTTVAEANAWRAHTSGDVRVTTFPGDHFYLAARQQEVTGLVARVLRTWSTETPGR
jgi:surfactin synthase thioesterase subunit